MKAYCSFITTECQCNCFYCSRCDEPGKGTELTEQQVVLFCRTASNLGYDTIELAGGEPLLYPDISGLVKKLKEIEKIQRVFITTNGILLSNMLPDLEKANLDGINFHIDSFSAQGYTESTGLKEQLNNVLDGLWKAVARGFTVYITVGLHEASEDQWIIIANLAKRYSVTIRFAELENGNFRYKHEDVLNKIRTVTGNIEADTDGLYHPTGWKGTICFADSIHL